jgi:hypothetical protein
VLARAYFSLPLLNALHLTRGFVKIIHSAMQEKMNKEIGFFPSLLIGVGMGLAGILILVIVLMLLKHL